MRRSAVALLFPVLFLSACLQKETPLTEEEVLAALSAFDKAWLEKRASTVDSILAPTYMYFTQSGGTFNRASLVETAGSPDYSLEKMSRGQLKVYLQGNTAVVSTRWYGKGEYMRIPFDEDQRCSVTIHKRNGKVEILSEHCTPIRPTRLFH